MKKYIMMMAFCSVFFIACLGPMGVDPDDPYINISVSGEISTTDVTAAVLLLSNKSKTVDVTNVTITQPEWTAPAGNPNAQPSTISFSNKPRRLEKKAQYLSPSDKSYQIVIDYEYDACKDVPAGSDSQTIVLPLPLPRQIVEVFIFRNAEGEVVIDKDSSASDPSDTGPAKPDPLPGEGSSPAIIPPELRSKMATFVVVSKTNSQFIEGVSFKMGDSSYTVGTIGTNDKQSIALGQGSWETKLTYIREGDEKVLGPVNSIIVPSNDPQAVREHYLYFYLNKRGDYSVSQDWPPFPNDVEEEDLLPVDTGNGRGIIKIVNNSNAIAKTVTIHNLHNNNGFPRVIDYTSFTPPIPIQNNRTGYVDVVGTANFPIEGHDGYLIQITVETNSGFGIIDRKAYLKDQVVTIIIEQDDLHLNNTNGAKVILENKTSSWPIEITAMTIRNKNNYFQSSYFDTATWTPHGVIAKDRNAYQYVVSTPAMPIVPSGEFEVLLTIYGNGVSTSITKDITPPTLYSDDSPDQNTRTITVDDGDVPNEIKVGHNTAGAKVVVENKITSWDVQVVSMMVRCITNPNQSTYYGPATWAPRAVIDRGENAVQMVYASANMPIVAGVGFEAVFTLYNNGKVADITRTFSPAVLYTANPPEQNIRNFSLTDADVPAELAVIVPQPPALVKGANVTIYNNVNSWPIQILGMVVQNKLRSAEKTTYYWDAIENNESGTQMVRSTIAMPINNNEEFAVSVYLAGNGKMLSVPAAFSPFAALYSDFTAEQNVRTITIRDGDVPDELKPQENQSLEPDQIIKNEIADAEIGEVILIDGIYWIKAKEDIHGNVLLLKEGVLPGGAAPMNTFLYQANVNYMDYFKAKIKTDVDNWYRNVQSPVLKRIALKPVIPDTAAEDLAHTGQKGASVADSLAGASAYQTVLFIPRYADIKGLAGIQNPHNNLGNTLAISYDYWLNDLVIVPNMGNQYRMGLIKGGSLLYREAANFASIRPVIWVTTR